MKRNTKTIIKEFLNNWKLVIHLLFRTYKFGVNNKWWSDFRSTFGVPVWKRYRLIQNYRSMEFRAHIGFLPRDKANIVFPYFWKRLERKRKTGDR